MQFGRSRRGRSRVFGDMPDGEEGRQVSRCMEGEERRESKDAWAGGDEWTAGRGGVRAAARSRFIDPPSLESGMTVCMGRTWMVRQNSVYDT